MQISLTISNMIQILHLPTRLCWCHRWWSQSCVNQRSLSKLMTGCCIVTLLTQCSLLGGPGLSSEPKLFWAPLWHRWSASARQNPHPCRQAVFPKPGGQQWEVQGSRGVCHQRWKLHEASQSWAFVTRARCWGKPSVTHDTHTHTHRHVVWDRPDSLPPATLS